MFDINLSFFKLHTILAPIGYPLIVPRINAIVAFGGILKIGLAIFVSSFEERLMKLVLYNISVAIKKGKSEGNTLLIKRESPFFAAIKFVSEKSNNESVKSIKTIVKQFFFKLIIKKFIIISKFKFNNN